MAAICRNFTSRQKSLRSAELLRYWRAVPLIVPFLFATHQAVLLTSTTINVLLPCFMLLILSSRNVFGLSVIPQLSVCFSGTRKRYFRMFLKQVVYVRNA